MVHSVVGEHLEQLGEDIVQSHVRSAPISYPSVDLSRRVCNLPRRYESTQLSAPGVGLAPDGLGEWRRTALQGAGQ